MGVSGSNFSELGDINSLGVVIMTENALILTIENTVFDSNINTYIHALGGKVDITGSTFKSGSGESFIRM